MTDSINQLTGFLTSAPHLALQHTHTHTHENAHANIMAFSRVHNLTLLMKCHHISHSNSSNYPLTLFCNVR